MRTFLALLAGLALTAQAGITSSYTNTEKDCRFEESDSPEAEGKDLPKDCPGPGEYHLGESYSALGSSRYITQGIDGAMAPLSLDPGDCPIAVFGKMLEWRMRDGSPFAVIQRATCMEPNETSSGRGRTLGEWIVVRELHGSQRKVEIDALRTPKANAKARGIADKF